MKYVLVVMMLMGTMMAQKAAAPKATLTPHSVSLTWVQGTINCAVPPCAAVVTGNNVYRGTVSGGPYTAIAGACSGPCTAYTDTTVTQGATYYYTVTTLCAACTATESPKSNEAKAGPIPQDSTPNAPVLNTPVVSGLLYPWLTEALAGL
jgi:hypothetical protein